MDTNNKVSHFKFISSAINKYFSCIVALVFIIFSIALIKGDFRLHEKHPAFDTLVEKEGLISWSSRDKYHVAIKIDGYNHAFLLSSVVSDVDQVGEKIDDAIGQQVRILHAPKSISATKNSSFYSHFYNVYELELSGNLLVSYASTLEKFSRIEKYYVYLGILFFIVGFFIIIFYFIRNKLHKYTERLTIGINGEANVKKD